MRKLFFYLGLIIILGFIALFFVWQAGWYHVLKVNNERISAKDYYGRLAGFEFYRKQTHEELDEQAVKRGIVLALIFDSLIGQELARRGIDAVQIEARLDQELASKKDDLEKAASSLYGWTMREFKKFSLEPQARQDILVAELEKEGIDFNDWLQEQLQKAEVKIHYLPYDWHEGQLVDKSR